MRLFAIFGHRNRQAERAYFPLRHALGLLFLCLPQAATADRQILRGHVPPAAAALQPVGDLPASQSLDLLIGLPLRNREALTNLLNDLYNPASPGFHQYLTPTQFIEQFGPTPADYQSVIDFAKASGLEILRTYHNRTLLRVRGAVANIEKAFHVHMRLYPHPTEKRTFYAPVGEPSVELATPLLGITGLDNFVLPHPLNVRAAKKNRATPQVGSGPSETYWGNDFRAAYVPGTTLTGAGQSVGLFELDDFYTSDVTTYESDAKLPNVPLTRLTVDGYTSGSPGVNNVEVALDIEMAVSMAPGLAGILVYEGPNSGNVTSPNDILNCMATNDAAKQLSCSWSFGINSSTVQIFQQFGTQGQSFFLASGDSGAFTGPATTPSDDPYITVVGGTTLSTSSAGGSWQSEVVWNWFSSGSGTNASTGGISTTYAIPSWQAPVSMANNQGSTTKRNLPDVALTADNIWVVAHDGSTSSGFAVGGTSCAAPLWAAFTALVNQQGAINQRASVGFLNPALYALGLGANYAATFHDITSGNNTNLSVANKFYAVAGYDLCTGWGTPNGTNMINALAPPATTPILTGDATLIAESCLPTNDAIDPGETVTLNITLTNLSRVATTNLVATLPASSAVLLPTAPQTYGALVGGGAVVTKPFTFTASGACGATISVALQLQDGSKNLGSITFNFALGKLLSATTFAQNFDSVTPPALPANWSASVTGEQVNWVTTSAASDTSPNSVFATDVANPGVAYLYSPVIPIASSDAQLTFRQNYDLESYTSRGTTTYYDGGVLDLAIGSGSFEDIISAGGSFVTGGYNGALFTGSGNPLAGRQAWSGDSGGWITTTINLPSSAAGQNIQLRWDCATDDGNSSTVVGWYVDTISILDGYYSCCGDSANLSLTQAAAPAQFVVGQNGTYTLTLTNSGPDLATDVVVSDTLPAGVTFVSASPGGAYSNGMVVFPVGTLSSGASSNMTVTVLTTAAGVITNSSVATSVTPSSNSSGNTAVNITTVSMPQSIILSSPAFNPARGLSVSVNSAQGLNYSLAYKNLLTDPSWTILPSTTVPGTGGLITLQDLSPAQAQRFYVVVEN